MIRGGVEVRHDMTSAHIILRWEGPLLSELYIRRNGIVTNNLSPLK